MSRNSFSGLEKSKKSMYTPGREKFLEFYIFLEKVLQIFDAAIITSRKRVD